MAVRSRQEPGNACEECRRRKLKCDRKEPRCGLCEESGEECIFVGSRKRGPKRGHMKVLLDRLSVVEKRLEEGKSGSASKSQTPRNTSTVSSGAIEPNSLVDDATNGFNLPPMVDLPTDAPPLDHPSAMNFPNWVWHGIDDFFPPAPFDPGQMSSHQSSRTGELPENGSGSGSGTSIGSGNGEYLVGSADDMDDVISGRPSQPLAGTSNGSSIDINVANMASIPVLSADLPDHSLPPTADNPMAGLCLLPDLHHSDRDQLYFDRVHACIPIIHEQNYSSWSTHVHKTEQQICLQQTMWALASSVSAQSPSVGHSLYTSARQRLEKLEAAGPGHETMDVMQAQAWLLLAIYEFVRVHFRRGWMSAGRAFRRIQLMRLHDVDRYAERDPHPDPNDWVLKEERRRTFWMAYALDRFVGVSDGSASTFNEEADVYLPAPEINFQAGQPIAMPFLSEVLLAGDRSGDNSLLEFIITATICGRANAHQARTHTSRLHAHDPSQEFWARHESITAILALQVRTLAVYRSRSRNSNADGQVWNSPDYSSMRHLDPLTLFTHIMAQTMNIYMYRLMVECVHNNSAAHQGLIDEYLQAFPAAVSEMSAISRTLGQMSCFKAHPFCPIALYICLDCLASFEKSGGGFADHIKLASNALGNLRRVNIFGGMGADISDVNEDILPRTKSMDSSHVG